jgi:hypothetical protein
MTKRRRSKSRSFEARIAEATERLREQASLLPSGPAKDALLGKIRELKTASQMNDWLRRPG